MTARARVRAWRRVGRRWLRWPRRRELLACLLLLLVAAAGVAQRRVWPHVSAHPYFAVEQVAVRGVGPLLSERELLDWLAVGEGTSLWKIDPVAVEQRLARHPMVGFVVARRHFPNKFEVFVRERRPRALLVLDELFYVDRRGETFGPLAAKHSRDFPVITGVGEETPHGYRKWALRRAMHLLRRCEQRGCPIAVSEVHLDPTRGVVLYPRQPRVPVVLGWASWEKRMARAARVLRSWDGATELLKTVDARFRDQVVVALHPAVSPMAKVGKDGLAADRMSI